MKINEDIELNVGEFRRAVGLPQTPSGAPQHTVGALTEFSRAPKLEEDFGPPYSAYSWTADASAVETLKGKLAAGMAQMKRAKKAGEFKGMPKRERAATKYISACTKAISALNGVWSALGDIEDAV